MGTTRLLSDPNSTEQRDGLLMQARLAYREGQFSSAAALCKQLLVTVPRFVPAMVLLGMLEARTGRTSQAIRLLERAVKVDSNSVDAWNELATQLRTAGRMAEAIRASERAIRLRPAEVTAHNNLGLCYLAQRRLAEAAASFERAIAAAPNIAGLHLNLGFIQQTQGENQEAAHSYRSAIALAPDYAEAHARLGHVTLMRGSANDALQCFQRAAASAPLESIESSVRIAGVLSSAGQVDLAEGLLNRVIARHPNSGFAHFHLGRVLQQRGTFAEAIRAFEKALALDPDLVGAWLGIVSCGKVTEAQRGWIERMTSALRQRSADDAETVNLHYALGKAYDDLNDPASAMQHYDAANRLAAVRLRRTGKPIDLRLHAATVDRIIQGFPPGFLAQQASTIPAEQLPILIVGMIRSGTTLVEQIISSHPRVGAGGELRFWGERAQNAVAAIDGTLDWAGLEHLASEYCDFLRALAPGAERITDKMPTNFMLLGLICLALPGARIIHCKRHPVDTCLSIYVTPFERSPDFAHNRETIVTYYREYQRLMAHWRRVLPADRFLEVSYEELVTNRERVTREIIAFCGLDWNDACLRPEENARTVATPSLWQARQPVYRSSLERWRRYEPWLGQFRRLLAAGDAAHHSDIGKIGAPMP
jgi:tetratricopeptide (TPR) repeat protein